MYNQIFFTNVLRLLDEQHMTKSELADKAGISVSFLSDLTNGKANPSLKILDAIARALGTALPALLEITDLDEATLGALMEGQNPTSLPSGYVRVTAVLTPFQAFTVRRWNQENRKKLKR
ncbi:transcriptional regulator [Oxalobacteraceae bacterium A2-2]